MPCTGNRQQGRACKCAPPAPGLLPALTVGFFLGATSALLLVSFLYP